jgi:small-conductance mechanosensitive channel
MLAATRAMQSSRACSSSSSSSLLSFRSPLHLSRDERRRRRRRSVNEGGFAHSHFVPSSSLTNKISLPERRREEREEEMRRRMILFITKNDKKLRRERMIAREAAAGGGDANSDDLYSMDVMDDSSSSSTNNRGGMEKNTPRTLLPGVPVVSQEDSWLTKLITLCVGAVSFYAAFLAINTRETAEITATIVAQFIFEAFGRFLGLTPAPSPDKIIRVYLEDAALLFFLGSILRLSLFSGFFRFSERVQEIIKDIAGSVERGLLIASGSRGIGALLIGSAVFEVARITYAVQAITYLCILSGLVAATFSWEKKFFASAWSRLEKSGAAPATLARVNGAERVIEIITWVVAAIFCFKAIGLNLGALVTVGGVSGIAIGLASKQVLENALMGVLLYTTTPFIIGDTVKIPREGKELNYAEGQIIDIGLFRTAIKTLEREVILLPNSELGAMSIINVTRRGREFRFNERMTVRLKDASQLSKLLSTFRTMIKNDPRVLKTLHRRVFIEEVTPDGITLEFSFYVEAINKDQFLGIRSELWLSFVQAMKKARIQLARPERVQIEAPYDYLSMDDPSEKLPTMEEELTP